ncbi:DUF4870 domain-containing protein [Pseudolysinimonas kribbensis]|uniref:Membrane protein n=1 Tax=Pseudolysinimonas kribbensis TaxID=433641 RepID=A0ABQ6K9G1_9MICO|nr:DUF4870 domain-containing protein [Pseudolysinimonas kribbensis]GMA96577.1 membrane protein [Pseudolysinimonas kribbensis]
MTEPAAPAPQPQPAAPFSEAEDKQYATLATFLNIILLIPALIFYFAFKDRGPRIAEQSKENLNWTINISVIVVAAWILSIFFAFIPFVGWIISLLLGLIAWAALIVNLIFSIIGGVQLSGGQKTSYRYPFAIRVIK